MKPHAQLRLVVALSVAALAACGPSGGSAPVLDPIENQTGAVGTELVIELRASDTEADSVDFSFHGEGPGGEMDGANLRPYGDGSTALFRWRPLAKDVGSWTVSFEASDGGQRSSETITIEVRTADLADRSPLFRRPLPKGSTVLDLSKKDCIDLPIVVEDLDTASVTIRETGEKIAGAELQATGGSTAKWTWCPSEAQKRDRDTYALNLEADDGEGNVAPTYFLIHLREGSKPSCPGTAPVVTHVPADAESNLPPSILVDIEESGEVRQAFFYYSFTDPGDRPDLDAMDMRPMFHVTGETWGYDAPNPAAHKGSGESGSLYYVVVVEDNDDETGSCDHVTQAPATGSYKATFVNPGTPGNMASCQACTADIQCGGAADNCVRVNAGDNELRCAKGCSSNSDCPSDYRCSDAPLAGTSGSSAKQCVPLAGTCEAPTEGDACVDDGFEENDSFDAATSKPALTDDEVDGVICPGLTPGSFDVDWYRIVLTGPANLLFGLTGPAGANLNLRMTDDEGNLIQRSEGPTSTEEIFECLTAGTYYVRVDAPFGSSSGRHPYTLQYIGESDSCEQAECTDDSLEEDDDPGHSRNVTTFPYTKSAQQICSGDEDWYHVSVKNGETVHMKAKFDEAVSDLDIVVYAGNGSTMLTPCDERVQPQVCDEENGQSGNSDEYLRWTNDGPDTTFHFVVRGYDGSFGGYDVCIGKSAGQCP
jgi:hypothetical protein